MGWNGSRVLKEGREELRGPQEGAGGVGRPSWRTGMSREALEKGQEG